MKVDPTTSDFRAAFLAVKANSLLSPVAGRVEDLQGELGEVNLDRAKLRADLATARAHVERLIAGWDGCTEKTNPNAFGVMTAAVEFARVWKDGVAK